MTPALTPTSDGWMARLSDGYSLSVHAPTKDVTDYRSGSRSTRKVATDEAKAIARNIAIAALDGIGRTL